MNTVTFSFPKGHPHEGKTINVSGVQFTDGKAEVRADQAPQLATILTPYYGAAIEGSPEHEEIEQKYAGIHAAKKPKAAPKADDPNAGK